MAHCQALAVTEQLVTCVCLFDRDEPKILEKAVGSDYMRDHSNNVVAVSIKAPEWRDEAAPLCIELLYQDQDLRRQDSNGRRLYVSSEFDPETGHHESEAVHILNPKYEGLVREHVLQFPGGASVGLSKSAFARHVSEGAPEFTGVDFGGFRETFKLLEEAVARFSSLA